MIAAVIVGLAGVLVVLAVLTFKATFAATAIMPIGLASSLPRPWVAGLAVILFVIAQIFLPPARGVLLAEVVVAVAALAAPLLFAGPPARKVMLLLIGGAFVIAPLKAALPEEALWSPAIYGVVLAAAAAALLASGKLSSPNPRQVNGPIGLMGLFVALSFVSILYHWLIVSHGHAIFGDAMLRQTGAYLALLAMTAALSRICTERLPAYCATICLLGGATASALVGLQDYAAYVSIHQAAHREFATSTPDYFAGFLVMTIPITLALWIGSFGNRNKTSALLYGLSLLIQIPVLAATGSRFAVVAIMAGLVSLGVGIWMGARSGIAMPRVDRRAIALAAIVLLLGVGVAGHTILNRVVGPQARAQNNSIMFRWWTWKGCERTALANPIFGTGPGTFPYAYQRYAYVGFTRAAHDAYFQATTDTGFVAGAALTIGLLWMYASGMRSITRWSVVPPDEVPARQSGRAAGRATDVQTPAAGATSAHFLEMFAPADDRILIAGLASGLLAGLVHNLFDSDWYVTFNALTLWGIGGILLAFARHAFSPLGPNRGVESAARQVPAALTASLYALAAIVFLFFAVAQYDANQGESDADASSAIGDYRAAESLNPTRGIYPSELGFNVYQRLSDVSSAEAELKHAIDIEPNATNYRRLGRIYLRENRPADALKMFSLGLDKEWNDLDLYLLCAQAQTALGDTEGTLDSYRTLAAYQQEKIGLYPALGDYVEIRYAQADVPLGDDALAHHGYISAIEYYQRAMPLFRQYVDQDGTMGGRQSLLGGRPDPEADKQIYTLFTHANNGLVQAYQALDQPLAAARTLTANSDLDARFQSIITRATKATTPG